MLNRMIRSAAVLAATVSPAAFADGPLDGRWEARTTIGDAELDFPIEFSGAGRDFRGTFYDGDVPVTSTSGVLDGGSFVLKFDHVLGKLKGKLKDGAIEAEYTNVGRKGGYDYAIAAHRPGPKAEAAKEVPDIDGLWEIPHESSKGEKAWRLIVQQHGDEATASILRIDGDTGALRGRYKDGKFVLGIFAGPKALRLDVVPKKDGSLALRLHSNYARFLTKDGESEATYLDYVAHRPADARAKGLPEPSDPLKHTFIKDPSEPFRFKFPDANGSVVSSEDERFRNKVVVAVVTGTWCPNCHDEAQYLVELHRKYRDRGLEVVALDFEEEAQLEKGIPRVHAFIKKYGVEYPYLIAGSPLEMWTKVPQATNLNTWPATFFVGRDGRVKQVHAGFASPASGPFSDDLKKEFVATIERLLSENATASR